MSSTCIPLGIFLITEIKPGNNRITYTCVSALYIEKISAVRFIEGNYALMEYSKGWDEYKVWVIFLNPIRVLVKTVTLGFSHYLSSL